MGIAKFWLKEHEETLEFNRFGIITICLLIVCCAGGAIVGLGGLNSIPLLILLVSTTMSTLVLILAVCPIKWILTSGLIAIFVDLIIMAGLVL